MSGLFKNFMKIVPFGIILKLAKQEFFSYGEGCLITFSHDIEGPHYSCRSIEIFDGAWIVISKKKEYEDRYRRLIKQANYIKQEFIDPITPEESS